MADEETDTKAMQSADKLPTLLHGPKAEAVLPVEFQGAIGKQLKHVYGQMLAEPLPDKFVLLLDKLGKADSKS